MSSSDKSSQVPTETIGRPNSPATRGWPSATIVAVAMVLLALVGVGMTTADKKYAAAFWYLLVPVYGFMCVLIALFMGGGDKGRRDKMALRQVGHWAAVGLALGLDFYLLRSGEESGTAAGLNALLLLALGCLLAGVHLHWSLIAVGLLLAATFAIMVAADTYMWVIFAAGFAVIVSLFGAYRLHHRYLKSDKAKPLAPAKS